ncbi:MAG: hypothetical protein H7175_24640, partial [Burkholderiales bacterium]|nr:hypothetical protein [Anaerolineae bacterium]
MHTTLIKANIALVKGERFETQRLLRDYLQEREEQREGVDDVALVLWLDAQAQNQREERIERLKMLVAETPPDNIYHQLAGNYLAQEAEYQTKLGGSSEPDEEESRLRTRRRRIWLAAVGVAVAALVIIALTLINTGSPQPDVLDGLLTPHAAIEATRTPLPDRSIALVVDSYTIRYPGGIMQVEAFEDSSERVVNANTGVAIEPVPGARFYALKVLFECRIAVCDTPPQADLALDLDGEFRVEA